MREWIVKTLMYLALRLVAAKAKKLQQHWLLSEAIKSSLSIAGWRNDGKTVNGELTQTVFSSGTDRWVYQQWDVSDEHYLCQDRRKCC